ncbi:MAG: phage portal protein [Clostridia bacterium]|nr:phage portal protein [Clostridia bacterium]
MRLMDKLRRPVRHQNKARDKPDTKPDYSVMRGAKRTRADYTLTTSEAIYAAVSRISNTIAALPIHLYKGQELQRDHYLERMIAYEPNPCMTPFVFRQTMEASRNTEGSAYALMVPDETGRTVRLDVLDAARVRPLRDINTREMWYELGLDNGTTATVHGSSVIALRHMSASGEKGIKPVDVLRGTLDYDKDIKEFSAQQLEGVNNGVVLNIPGTGLNEARKKTIIKQFLDAYRESGGRLVVLEGGVTATTLTQSPVDAKVLDVERITRNRVATVYNIPPHMLGDYSDTSYATAEQSMLEYLQMTISPIVVQWENELNRKLLTWDMLREGYAFRFTLSDLWRADVKTMGEVRQMGIRSGWIKPNEVRIEEGRPADPNGDTLMISRDMVPLEVALQAKAETLHAAATNQERR